MGTLEGKAAFITGAGRGRAGPGQVQRVVDAGLGEFGRIDVVCANAGVGSWSLSFEMSEQTWKDMIDVNLTGVFNTVRAAVPSMVERGEGGSVVLTSSTAGLIGYQRTRVNAVCPTTVNTPLVINDATFNLVAPDVANPGPDDVREAFASLNAMPDMPWLEPSDVSEAVAGLCSDAARYITGIDLPIDAGNIVKKD